MCGIVSLFNGEKLYNRDVHAAIAQLISANTVRGVHSTGLVYGGDFEAETFKKAVPGHDFVELATVDRILMNYEDNSFLIGHNRAATRGTVKSANAHPFTHGHITGVHNGTLLTYMSLVDGDDPKYPVDSEYIFRGLEQQGAEVLIPKINGAYNLLWYDASDDTVHMIRNKERPYYFAKIKDKKLLFGASEMPMLQWILNRNGLTIEDVIVPEEMTEYVFDMSAKGDMFTPVENEHEEWVPKYVAPPVVPIGNGFGGGNSRTPRSVDFYAEKWESYGSNVPDNGKWECRTCTNERVVVYQCKQGDLEAGKWYSGTTRTAATPNAVYSVDVSSVKLWAGGGPDDKAVEELYRCVACRDYFAETDLIFCDAAPLCVDCVDHYEIDINKEEDTKCH